MTPVFSVAELNIACRNSSPQRQIPDSAFGNPVPIEGLRSTGGLTGVPRSPRCFVKIDSEGDSWQI
jgi:hypothetical protein